jgi:hypothetical protein
VKIPRFWRPVHGTWVKRAKSPNANAGLHTLLGLCIKIKFTIRKITVWLEQRPSHTFFFGAPTKYLGIHPVQPVSLGRPNLGSLTANTELPLDCC